MNDDLNVRARKIIEENVYITIATATLDGDPWISPLWAVHDKTYNFYWGSPVNTRHSRLIKENERASVVIFDSKAPEGTGEGVYFQGIASEISDEKELGGVIKLMFKENRPTTDFTGTAPRRLYKFIPSKAWMNAGDEADGYFDDHKIELNILKNE